MQDGVPRVPVPTHPALADLLQLRTGGAYEVDRASLALALLAAPSAEGAWSGSCDAYLAEQGYDHDKLPYCVQFNKRDLPNSAPHEELTEVLNPTKVPQFEAVATKGVGVFDTLKAVAKLVLTELKRGS